MPMTLVIGSLLVGGNIILKFQITSVAGLELENNSFFPEEVRLKYAGFSCEKPREEIQKIKMSKSLKFYIKP
jgi:hypothetical protein